MTAHRLHRAPRSLMPSGRNLRVLVAILAVIAIVLTLGGVAFAYLTATGSGTGTATTGTLNPPTAVAGSQVGVTSTVAVSWTAPVTGAAPTGYYVLRTPSPSGTTVAACGTSPASPTLSTSCNDASVPNGSYRYVVVAVHHTWTATSAQSAVVTVTVGDVTGPSIAITDPLNGTNGVNWGDGACGSGSNDRRICANVSDPSGVASVSVTLRRASDGKYYDGAGTNETDWVVASTSLPMTLNGAPLYRSAELLDRNYAINNTYTITVSATDLLGNSNTAASVFIIDTTNPTASITPAAPGHTNTGIVTITGTDANAVTISYRIDSNAGAFQTFAGSPFVTTLSAGTHTVDYFVTDASGRVSATVNNAPIVVDMTAPVAPAILDIDNDTGQSATDNITNDNTQILSGTSEPNATVNVTRTAGGGTASCTDVADGAGLWACPVISLLGGTNSYTATQTDLAGNVSAVSGTFTVLYDSANPFTAPITFPTASTDYTAATFQAGCSTPSAVDVCGTAADSGTAYSSGVWKVEYELRRTDGTDVCWNGTAYVAGACTVTPTRQMATGTTAWSAMVGTLTNGGSYTLSVWVTDVSGRESTVATRSFVG